MKSSAQKMQLASLDDLFSTQASRDEAQREKVQEIPLEELHPFAHHPFKVLDDDRMKDTADSIREYGVLVPAIARPRPDGGYELIAGHRRKRGCELARLQTMPVIVRELDDDAAIIIMIDSNIQRENILPSERAFAYQMKLEALKHQGLRSDLTSVQVGQKLNARAVIAKKAGESAVQVQRFIRLLVKTARGYARAKTEDGEEIPVLTTDANGMATWAGIDYGDYYVHEVVPPEGYQPNDEYVPISIRVQDALSYVSVSNEIIRGKLRIQKQDALTKEVLVRAAFTLTRLSAPASHNGAGVGEVVAVLTTDAAGVAEIDDLPWGRYLVTETKAPEHFEVPMFSTEVAITANEQVCELVVENEPTKGWLRLTKTDRLNGNPIAGVQFDIYEHDAYDDALVGSMVTDANGIAVSEPLRKGHYLVREHGATGGYVFEEVTLEATVKSDETTELQATNQPVQVRLKIYKRDAEEARKDNSILDTRGDGLLTGAEFRVLAGADITDCQGNVLYAKGDIVASSLITTGDEAAVMTEELWPGVYVIEEVTPPEGYLPSAKNINIDARDAAKQSDEAVVTYEGWVLNTIKYGAQAILKTLGSGSINPDPSYVEQPEPGAEFDVYLLSAGSYENARECERDHLKTNKRGYAKTQALPYGIYVLQQTKGQPGYELKGPITFEINGEEDLANPPQLVLSDQPIRYRLRLIKVDSETGKVITLAGTSFKLKDAQGAYVTQKLYYPTAQEIDTFTTDDSGTVLLPETVTWGAYFIEEIQAPRGYLIREDDFAVFIGLDGDEPGNTYTVDIEIPDQPVKGRILANNSNFDRNPLRGCNYGLEGGAVLILGGCSSLPKEEERLHEIMC